MTTPWVNCYIHPRTLPFLRAVAGSLRSLLLWRCLELRNLGIG